MQVTVDIVKNEEVALGEGIVNNGNEHIWSVCCHTWNGIENHIFCSTLGMPNENSRYEKLERV